MNLLGSLNLLEVFRDPRGPTIREVGCLASNGVATSTVEPLKWFLRNGPTIKQVDCPAPTFVLLRVLRGESNIGVHHKEREGTRRRRT
jgi:hypothetical protein